jgi:2-keto-4-pentenoate hydratase/2-oxohepta-3-ene-1,7-dioic acid hydratase in catechol pathway
VTARDLQRREDQWFRAKGFDTFCPLGPAIATDLDPADLRIRCTVDGEVRQDGTTADMVHGVAELVSADQPGHHAAAERRHPHRHPRGVGPIAAGQKVRVEIEGIGVLENPVVARATA